MKKGFIIGLSSVVLVIAIIFTYYNINHSKTAHSTTSVKQKTIKHNGTSITHSDSTLVSNSSALSESEQKSSVEESSVIASSSVTNDPNTASYNPNKTAQGTEVTIEMINKVRQELLQAGLPADKWGPSDIKKIITESSQQNMSVIDYAKANYHQ